MSAFAAVFIYEKLGRNLNLSISLFFAAAACFFLAAYLIRIPLVNIVFFVLAIAATMLWSRYCPSLRDTGMVSTATGFLDFMSYMAAAASSAVFADAVATIGWRVLILVCAALIIVGAMTSLPKKR